MLGKQYQTVLSKSREAELIGEVSQLKASLARQEALLAVAQENHQSSAKHVKELLGVLDRERATAANLKTELKDLKSNKGLQKIDRALLRQGATLGWC